jgi:hypothetical protein
MASSVSRYKWFSKLHTIVKIYSTSRGFSMLLQTLRRRCPRVRLRVPESYTLPFREKWYFDHIFFRAISTGLRQEIIISQVAQRYFLPRTVLFADFFFIFSILERIAFYVCRAHLQPPSITCAECTTLPSDLVPQFLANDFVISVLRALVTRTECHAPYTFVSNRLN